MGASQRELSELELAERDGPPPLVGMTNAGISSGNGACLQCAMLHGRGPEGIIWWDLREPRGGVKAALGIRNGVC